MMNSYLINVTRIKRFIPGIISFKAIVLSLLLTTCSDKKEHQNKEQSNNKANVKTESLMETKSETREDLISDPINFFLDSKSEIINLNELKFSSEWQLEKHNTGPYFNVFCISSDSLNQLIVWDFKANSYKINKPKILSGNKDLEKLKMGVFEKVRSTSENIFTKSSQNIQPDEFSEIPEIYASSVSKIEDSIRLICQTDTLSYNAVNTIENTGEGSENDNYGFYKIIAEKYYLLLKPIYGGYDFILIDKSTCREFRIEGISNAHSMSFSHDFNYLALTVDKGGYDANYDPNAMLLLYKLSDLKMDLICKYELGPIGKTQLKWSDSGDLFLSGICCSYQLKLSQETI